MEIKIRKLMPSDLYGAIKVWNEVVAAGDAFPQTELLNNNTAAEFFNSQTFTGVAENEKQEIVGVYILHPNNVGRCGHISNASYAVLSSARGQKVGEKLVRHCLATAKERGFKILQFNAVVATNVPALKLYEQLGFIKLGVIAGGFCAKNGEYVDIIPHYITL